MTGRTIRRQTVRDELAIKKAVRERDGMRCTECGKTNEQHIEACGKSLEVHRIVPGSLYTVEGCVTVCKSCHCSKPKRKRGEPDQIFVVRGYRLVSLPPRVNEALKLLADYHASSVTEMAKRACIEFLEKRGEWPPKS